jgi:hypothetical protein
MLNALNITLIVLSLASLCTLGYWSVVIAKIVRTTRTVPSLAAGLHTPDPTGVPARVCVVVPAHNEEFVFALDRCTDRTAQILKHVTGDDPRCEIIEIHDCEEGWVGKVHALHRAIGTSRAAPEAEILLFVDADTSLHHSCVRAAVNILNQRGLDMLSALSTLTSEKWFEKIVQPAAGVELLRQFPLIRANDPEKRRPFANGQFIMIRRPIYDSIGGHAAVKSEVLEDVWFARRVSQAGFKTGFLLSGGMLHCRMYSRWSDFRRGWLRIYGESASRKPHRLRGAARWLRLVGTILPLATGACVLLALSAPRDGGLIPLVALLTGIAAIAVFLAAVGIIYRLARVPLWSAPAYIAGAWIVGGLLVRAAKVYERNEPTIWGGKQYLRHAK